jgi:hypothetical protein
MALSRREMLAVSGLGLVGGVNVQYPGVTCVISGPWR